MQSNFQSQYEKIFNTHWTFLNEQWPIVSTTKNYRTIIKEIPNINEVNELLNNRLGVISVFFFLNTMFNKDEYADPYRHIEKGLLVLYHLVSECSINEMNRFIPSSTFYSIYKKIYIINKAFWIKLFSTLLRVMFSSIQLRIISAQINNPVEFKQVTLMLDGHDTIASYSSENSRSMYSYKLKKSGFRTQVCMDINEMIVFVSNSNLCSVGND